MTQENLEPQEPLDDITAIQQNMDAEQAGGQSASGVTLEQVQTLLQQQAQAYEHRIATQESQLRGLMSKQDNALNAIRGWTKDQLGGLETRIGRDRFLESLDEDQRRTVDVILGEMDRRMPPPEEAPITTPVQDASTVEEQWAQVYTLVESMGLNRSDPRIQYAALTDSALAPEQRRSQFMQSLTAAVRTAPAPTPTPAAPVANPPIDRGASGAGNAGRLQTVDSLMDLHIQGGITTEQYKERMAAIGHPVG